MPGNKGCGPARSYSTREKAQVIASQILTPAKERTPGARAVRKVCLLTETSTQIHVPALAESPILVPPKVEQEMITGTLHFGKYFSHKKLPSLPDRHIEPSTDSFLVIMKRGFALVP